MNRQQDWIACEEELPDDARTVLLSFDPETANPVWIGYYVPSWGMWQTADGGTFKFDPIAWRDLPGGYVATKPAGGKS